jgi:hypothetical protein
MGYSGAGGKLIHKKTRSKKSRDTVPLRLHRAVTERNIYGFATLVQTSRILIFPPQIQDPGVKEAPIPDPDPKN